MKRMSCSSGWHMHDWDMFLLRAECWAIYRSLHRQGGKMEKYLRYTSGSKKYMRFTSSTYMPPRQTMNSSKSSSLQMTGGLNRAYLARIKSDTTTHKWRRGTFRLGISFSEAQLRPNMIVTRGNAPPNGMDCTWSRKKSVEERTGWLEWMPQTLTTHGMSSA